MFVDDLDILMHYGTPRHSGRFPWGSGEHPYQSEPLYMQVRLLKKEGLTEKEIAEYYGMSTTQLRAQVSISNAQTREANRSQALKLHDKGYSNSKIGELMGVNESTVRGWLDDNLAARANRNEVLADKLKDYVSDVKYLDIGAGVEKQLGVTSTSLKTAVAILEEQGYKKQYLKIEQPGNPGNYTWIKVLTKDDISWSELNENRDQIRSPLGTYSEDKGHTWRNIKEPVSISSDRIEINYSKKNANGEEIGGGLKDGVIELRPGVEDISLGQNQYAQVRIAVDGTHYLKGMAMYNNNLPDGVDIRFNTNKTDDVAKMDVLKGIKEDPDNPFGATVRQYTYISKDGTEHQSAINIVNDESDWGNWSRTLSSQVLSKQSPELAKRQLGIKYSQREQEYKEIMSIPNATLRKVLLLKFADSCDSDSVHLKAAAMPRQEVKVILPLTDIKDNEIYAPTYKNGEKVALIRYPHGGIFEIPVLTVNNKNLEGNDILKQASHAVGINAKVAEQLSGADFDGDTVTVIPLKNQHFKYSKPLDGLKNFDPQERYRAYEGMEEVEDGKNFQKQMEMGKVSNLITDMTIAGATPDELARAVRHSMVIIDAEKHNLDWKRSETENGIKQLKEKYQGGKNAGAATLISKASSEYDIPQRKPVKNIDPETGRYIYTETGATKTYYKKNAKTGEWTEKQIPILQTSTKMDNAFDSGKDAYSLSSGSVIESVYADHANKLRALANQARKNYISTEEKKKDPVAASTYSKEVESLNAKLDTAILNAPRERQATILADKYISTKIKENPALKDRNHKDELNKIKQQALAEARQRSGAMPRSDKINKTTGEIKEGRAIHITDREWEAIDAGAISKTKLEQILNNTDLDELKAKAIPRDNKALNTAVLSRAKALLAAGYTQAEVAEACGISVSTLRNNDLI
jgi:predicted transcriptional regulator